MVPLDDQGPTFRCGPFAALEWFQAYVHSVILTATQAWADAINRADAQRGSSFSDERDYITWFAAAANAQIEWLGDGEIRDLPTLDQAVRDGWCVVVGVLESDLHPGQNYYHFLAVDGIGDGTFSVKDSFHVYDGEAGHPSIDALHQAINDNWQPGVVGLAWKFA